MYRFILLSIILFLCSCSEELTEVNGNVFDKKSNPVVGAIIDIYNIDTKNSFTATTNSNGDFSINEIPKGKYLIIAKSIDRRSCAKSHLYKLKANYSFIDQVFNLGLSERVKEISNLSQKENDFVLSLSDNSIDPVKSLEIKKSLDKSFIELLSIINIDTLGVIDRFSKAVEFDSISLPMSSNFTIRFNELCY